ncbi:threonine/serine exporter family protein [Nesterenkonia sp. Act20]|uniref:threonine/serine ThrE exporter family protein n=1 Tax=Nesterenkonia sp. Act20 TaxID=1483432 RepID=UPI001C4418A8
MASEHTERHSTGEYVAEAIDPVRNEPTADVTHIPVVHSTQEILDETPTGFVQTLRSSFASSWNASAEAEAALEWEEYDADAVARSAAVDENESARHEYVADPRFEQSYTTPQDASEVTDHYAFPITGDWQQTDALGPQIPTGPQETTTSWAHRVEQSQEPPASGLISLPHSAPGAPLRQSPMSHSPKRGALLRPSWLKGRREASRSADFDPSVFDRKPRSPQVLRRIMQAERAATGFVPIVDRLAGTPYANPYQPDQQVETDELATIAFVLDLGEALFRFGAGALEVETSIIAVTAAFGMKNTDADITNQSISLNWAPEGKIPYSRVRVVRSWSNNFRALASVHQLVTDIIAGRLTRGDAEDRLREITREPKPYPRWMVTICGAIFASFFAAFLGAPILDAAMGFAATILVLWTVRQLATWRVPEYFGLAAGGFVATSFAMGAFAMDMPIRPSMVVAGGLMILLPSARIVSAIQDGINGFPITAAGRLTSSMIAFAGMTSGIMAAVVIANLLGAPPIEVAVGLTRIYHPTVLVALVFLAAIAAAVVEQASWRMLLPIGAVSALGFSAFYAAELIGLGERITPVFGAVVVGGLGRILALRLGSPQLVVAVPAMMFMLPGLMVFRGMYAIAMDSTTDAMMGGLTELFNALIIIMAIAAGIVLGDVLMRPLTAGLQSHERARTRRR